MQQISFGSFKNQFDVEDAGTDPCRQRASPNGSGTLAMFAPIRRDLVGQLFSNLLTRFD